MARRSISEQLAHLDQKRKTLISKQTKQERARDTRRKVLLGAFVLHRLDKGQDDFSKNHLRDWLKKELPGFITREDDAGLFDDVLKKPQPKPPSEKAESGKAGA